MTEAMKASDIIFLCGFAYAKARGFLHIGEFVKKACDRCGKEIVVNCQKHNGLLYADKQELDYCKACREYFVEQEKQSLKLATALS